MNEEPGQAHLRWLRKYRNSTGFITFPGLFYTRHIMATSSLTVQHILNNMNIYVKGEQARRAIESFLGKGLLTAEGEIHKKQRKVLNPAFATSYIRGIFPIFSAKAEELVDTLLEQVKSQSAEGINVLPLLNRSTLDIMGSAGLCYV
jgi:cytochrome P450